MNGMIRMTDVRTVRRQAALMVLLCAPLVLCAADKTPQVVMLGDSTTYCGLNKPGAKLTELVQASLMRSHRTKATIVNSGVNRDTARGDYARLQAAVLAHDPDVVTVSFGLNDTIAYSPDEFRDWLEKIVTTLAQKSRARILLVTSTPFDNARHSCGKAFAARGGLDEYLDANLCAQVRMVAQKHNLPVCDLHRIFKEKFKKSPSFVERYILPDGVHLTEDGNKAAAESLAPMFARLIMEK